MNDANLRVFLNSRAYSYYGLQRVTHSTLTCPCVHSEGVDVSFGGKGDGILKRELLSLLVKILYNGSLIKCSFSSFESVLDPYALCI